MTPEIRVALLRGLLHAALVSTTTFLYTWTDPNIPWKSLLSISLIPGLTILGTRFIGEGWYDVAAAKRAAKAVPIVLALLLVGCGGLGGIYTERMTAEQIAAAVKDKNLTMACIIANTPYGKGMHIFLNLDKLVLPPNSSVKNDDACKFEITTGGAKP